jgi:NAD(P) transhydrogenase subunit alpha
MMYARNITAFLTYVIKEQKLNLNLSDKIVSDTLLTHGGEIVQGRVREFLTLPALAH